MVGRGIADTTTGQIRANIPKVVGRVLPDDDLSRVKGEVRIKDRVEVDSMDFPEIIMKLRKRYGIEVLREDYVKPATLDSAAAYLERRMAQAWNESECMMGCDTPALASLKTSGSCDGRRINGPVLPR